jgi:hypothetical protein
VARCTAQVRRVEALEAEEKDFLAVALMAGSRLMSAPRWQNRLALAVAHINSATIWLDSTAGRALARAWGCGERSSPPGTDRSKSFYKIKLRNAVGGEVDRRREGERGKKPSLP